MSCMWEKARFLGSFSAHHLTAIFFHNSSMTVTELTDYLHNKEEKEKCKKGYILSRIHIGSSAFASTSLRGCWVLTRQRLVEDRKSRPVGTVGNFFLKIFLFILYIWGQERVRGQTIYRGAIHQPLASASMRSCWLLTGQQLVEDRNESWGCSTTNGSEMFQCASTHSVTSSGHLLNCRRPLVAYEEFWSPMKQTNQEADEASVFDPDSSQKSFRISEASVERNVLLQSKCFSVLLLTP